MGKQSSHSHVREIWALVLVGVAVLLLLSLLSYNPFDVGNTAAGTQHPIHNFIGPIGAWIAHVTFSVWGIGGYVLMAVLGIIGGMLLLGREVPWRGKVGAGVLLLVSSACLLHIAGMEGARKALNLPSAGGFVGMFVGDFFTRLLGAIGTVIIFVVAYLVSLILLINFTPSYWVALSVETAEDIWQGIRKRKKPAVQDELAEKEREIKIRQYEVDRELGRKEREARKLEEDPPPARPEPKIEDRTQPLSQPAKPPVSPKKEKPAPAAASLKPKTQPQPSAAILDSLLSTPYELPPVSLLDPPAAGVARSPAVVEDLKLNAEILRSTLEEFGIQVQVTDVTKGPVVTLYEMVPAPGVKVEKIAALSNNVALAMKAVTVRILTPVPGKGTVGIEVPNSKSTMVYLRDMLESGEYRKSAANMRVPIVLGRDVAGTAIIGDLADMPHMLIAGATGSGKTVCVNAILASLLYRFGPEDLRLVLIDPKMVEMSQYNVLPHLVVPVVTEAKKVTLALRWCINEMEKRFQILAKVGVRNVAAFNARPKSVAAVADHGHNETDQPEETVELKIEVPRDDELVIPEKLPYIIVVIDELADLMQQAGADIENAIARLTALSRAVGIHMIIATQRPSVDVVTGVIKANIPARVAFQVASKQDSRVVLDANGADKLLGKGDMLYLPPGSSKLIRAQGVLVQDPEIQRLCDFIGKQAKPRFVAEIHQKLSKKTILPSDMSEEEAEEDEALAEQALEVIRQTNRASVSILQRRLRIGYTRAARIMDLLEERGVVGPNKGAEPRDILTDLDAKVQAE